MRRGEGKPYCDTMERLLRQESREGGREDRESEQEGEWSLESFLERMR